MATYNFYVDGDNGNDDYSGSSVSLRWSGTLTSDIVGKRLTRGGGDDAFVEGAPGVGNVSVGDFVRFDPGGGDDANVRVTNIGDPFVDVVDSVGNTLTKAANIGGMFASIQSADDNIPNAVVGTSVDADVDIYVRALDGGAAYTPGAILTFDNNTSAYYRRIIGWADDWNLGGWQTDGTLHGPIIDFGGANNWYVSFPSAGGDRYMFMNFEVRNTNTTATSTGIIDTGSSANGVIIMNCKIHDNQNGQAVSLEGSGDWLIACDITDYKNIGVYCAYGRLLGCRVHTNAGVIFPPIELRNDAAALYCVVEDVTGLHASYGAIRMAASGAFIVGCTVHSCNQGITDNSGVYGQAVINSISTGSDANEGLVCQYGAMLLGVAYNSKTGPTTTMQPIPDEDILLQIAAVTDEIMGIGSGVFNAGWMELLPMSLRAECFATMGAHKRKILPPALRAGAYANIGQSVI